LQRAREGTQTIAIKVKEVAVQPQANRNKDELA